MLNEGRKNSFRFAINELLKAIDQGQRTNVALRLRKTPPPEDASSLVAFCARKSGKDRKNLEVVISKYFKHSECNRREIEAVINSFLENQPQKVCSIAKSEYQRFESENGLPFSPRKAG